MKDTDKVTMTIGQLKRLLKESNFLDNDTNKKFITYNDILDRFIDMEDEDYQDVFDTNGADLTDWIFSIFPYAKNNRRAVEKACIKVAREIWNNGPRGYKNLRKSIGHDIVK